MIKALQDFGSAQQTTRAEKKILGFRIKIVVSLGSSCFNPELNYVLSVQLHHTTKPIHHPESLIVALDLCTQYVLCMNKGREALLVIINFSKCYQMRKIEKADIAATSEVKTCLLDPEVSSEP